jgi:hypothetical protein
MDLIHFKQETVNFDEHHLQNILFNLYDDEKYYVLQGGDLIVEDYEWMDIPSNSEELIENNFTLDTEYDLLTNSITVNIYRLKFVSPKIEKELYRHIIFSFDTLIFLKLIGNLLYCINGTSFYVTDINTGDCWKISISFVSMYENIENMVIYNNKIILMTTGNIYIINKDGTYNTIKGYYSALKTKSGKLYLHAHLDHNITTVDLNNIHKNNKTPIHGKDLFDFFITQTSTVLVHRYEIIIHGPKKLTINVSDFNPPSNISIKMSEASVDEDSEYHSYYENPLFAFTTINKNNTKLGMLIYYGSSTTYGCFVVIDLMSGLVTKRIELDDVTSGRGIGFLNTNVNQEPVLSLIIELKIPVEIESKSLETVKI